MHHPPHPLRRALDSLYRAAETLAALGLVAILVFVLVQMLSRLFAVTVPGMQDFAGYCLAGTTFLALGASLRAGSHIRVNLLLTHVGARAARTLDLWCCALGVAVAAYVAYWSADLVWDSYQYGEVASALVSTPLWIPRLTMPLGALVLLIAFLDELVCVARGDRPRYEGAAAEL